MLGCGGVDSTGVVARNSEGGVVFAATRRTRVRAPPEIAEAKAIAMAVRLGRRYGLEEVIKETDCQFFINRLSKNATYFSDLDSVLGVFFR